MVRILKLHVTTFLNVHSITVKNQPYECYSRSPCILELGGSHIVGVLFHGKKFLDISSNTNTQNAIIDFLVETKRFDEILFWININETIVLYIFIFKVQFFSLGISLFNLSFFFLFHFQIYWKDKVWWLYFLYYRCV